VDKCHPAYVASGNPSAARWSTWKWPGPADHCVQIKSYLWHEPSRTLTSPSDFHIKNQSDLFFLTLPIRLDTDSSINLILVKKELKKERKKERKKKKQNSILMFMFMAAAKQNPGIYDRNRNRNRKPKLALQPARQMLDRYLKPIPHQGR